MVGIAIFSTDPVLCRNLEQLPRDDPAVVIVGMVDQASSLRELDNRDGVDVLVADVPTQELLAEYRAGRALVVLLDGTDSENTVRALSAGAHAVLDRSASRNEIIAAIKAVSVGLVVVAPQLLARLFNEAPFADELFKASAFRARLTRRELEVLVAMAMVLQTKRLPVAWVFRSTPPSFMSLRYSPSSMLTVGPKRWRRPRNWDS